MVEEWELAPIRLRSIEVKRWAGYDFGNERSENLISLAFLYNRTGVLFAPICYHLTPHPGGAPIPLPPNSSTPTLRYILTRS